MNKRRWYVGKAEKQFFGDNQYDIKSLEEAKVRNLRWKLGVLTATWSVTWEVSRCVWSDFFLYFN